MPAPDIPPGVRPAARPDWVPAGAGPAFATRVQPGAASGPASHSHVGHRRRQLTVDALADGVLAGNRTVLGQAITLIESNLAAHQDKAQALLARLLPNTGRAQRVGITGIPGAGKSTFIEALGCHVTALGHKVAVLAVDPSSTLTGGSILGDKVRMAKLAQQPAAFIRPSPSGGSLGGVARKTREAILVCEAAGFDVVIVETVGVGQSEVSVRSMVDYFLVLLIAGAGDEIQGIKKGIIELADAIVINKADGDNRVRATATQAEISRVLHYLQRTTMGWEPPAILASALTGEGLPQVWETTQRFFEHIAMTGALAARRRTQGIDWMHALVSEQLHAQFFALPSVQARLAALEAAVADGRTPALAAARDLIAAGRP